jgi:hypothetical protein
MQSSIGYAPIANSRKPSPTGPDPLPLAAVFGLDPKTAIRYADNAKALLTGDAEEQDPAGSPGPKGRNHP